MLGGIDPQALFSLFAVSVALAVLGCSLALAISVRATKTHDVIIAVLALWILWLLSLPIWSGTSSISGVVPAAGLVQEGQSVPAGLCAYAWPGYVSSSDVAIFVVVVLLLSTALIAFDDRHGAPRACCEPARPVSGVARSSTARASRWLAWLPGPSLDGNPVLWREWHRNRPSRLRRIIWVIYVISSVAGVGIGIHEAIVYGMGGPTGPFALIIALHLQFLFGLMIVSVQAPTSLAEERVRGSLDVL